MSMGNPEAANEVPKQRVAFRFPDGLYERMARHCQTREIDPVEFLRLAYSFRRVIEAGIVNNKEGDTDLAQDESDAEPLRIKDIPVADEDIGDFRNAELRSHLAVLYEADGEFAEGQDQIEGVKTVAITMPLTLLHDIQLTAFTCGYTDENALLVEAALDYCYALELAESIS